MSDLSKVLGGGGASGHKATKWMKWIFGVLAALVVWATSATLGALITVAVVGVLIVLDCIRHPLHIIRYVGAMVLFVALLPNVVFGGWMLDMGHAVGSGGDRLAPVAQNWLPSRPGGVFNQTPAPAPVQPAPPAGTPGVVSAPTTTMPAPSALPASATSPLPPAVPLR